MARIDDSHQPFKRKRSIGPGPKRRPRVKETKTWRCVKGKNTAGKAGKYVQKCTNLKTGKKLTVKTWKSTKKKYNKVYRAWLKRHSLANKGPVATYRCRRQLRTKCK